MKHSLAFKLLTLSAFLFSCSYLPQRLPQSVSNVVPEVQEPTMIVLVSNNRMPASGPSVDLSKPNDEVFVSAQTVKLPGDTMKHGSLMFSVRNHPDLSAQISGHSEGGILSKKFTQVMDSFVTKGLTSKDAKIIAETQKKILSLKKLPQDQREDALKEVLFETRKNLLALH